MNYQGLGKNLLDAVPGGDMDSPLLVETKSGDFSLKVRGEDGAVKALHSLYDPVREAQGMVDRFNLPGDGLLVVVGLGLGYHVSELAKRCPGVEIVAVERASSMVALAREHGPLGQEEARVRLVTGLTADEVIKEITRLQLKAGMVPVAVFPLPAAVSAFPLYYDPILTALKKTEATRLWERLKYPKFSGDTVRALLIDFDYFLTREIEKAVKGLGHEVLRLPVRKGEGGERIVSRLLRQVIEFKPDFLITLNHLGLDEEGVLSSFLNSIEMPLASWYVDSPNLILKAFEKNVSPYAAVFLWDRSYMHDMKQMGFEAVSYLPLASDCGTFHPIDLNPQERADYSCDVGFVGNSMVEAVDRWFSMLSGPHKTLVESLAWGMLDSRQPFLSFLETRPGKEQELVQGLKPRERMDLEAAVLWRVTQLYRLSCVETLAGFDARIYGDRGWERILEEKVKRQVRICPGLDYYRELPLLYNACKVNLNATSLQMAEAVNQRVFDVPACGRFLLTDAQTAVEELFVAGEEVILYQHPEEIPDLVKYYLDHPAERKKISRAGSKRVLKEHTYEHRLNTIIEQMKKRYA